LNRLPLPLGYRGEPSGGPAEMGRRTNMPSTVELTMSNSPKRIQGMPDLKTAQPLPETKKPPGPRLPRWAAYAQTQLRYPLHRPRSILGSKFLTCGFTVKMVVAKPYVTRWWAIAQCGCHDMTVQLPSKLCCGVAIQDDRRLLFSSTLL
jgi:hypothetical protein